MKGVNQKTILFVGILIFTLMLGTAAAVQTNLTVLADNSFANRLINSVQVSKETSNLQTENLVEESVFHRFIKRGKDLLSLVGQRLRFVFAKYAQVPSALIKALDQLTDGRGPGNFVKIFLLFLLLIAVGFGAEKFLSDAPCFSGYSIYGDLTSRWVVRSSSRPPVFSPPCCWPMWFGRFAEP